MTGAAAASRYDVKTAQALPVGPYSAKKGVGYSELIVARTLVARSSR
jgi:hypothetical protein